MGHFDHAPPPLNRENLAYGQNANLKKLPQWKITKIVATSCQNFKTKKCIHQTQLRLEIRLRLHRRSLQRSPDLLAGFKRPASMRREGSEGWKGRNNGRRKGERDDALSRSKFLNTPLPLLYFCQSVVVSPIHCRVKARSRAVHE